MGGGAGAIENGLDENKVGSRGRGFGLGLFMA